MRFIFALVVGISAGYFIGWKDAKKYDKTIVERLVDRAGGATRGKISNDMDAKMREADSGVTAKPR